VKLTITLSEFNYQDQLEKLPELEFSPENPDYWLLLPVFEEIETATEKLIDLGESVEFAGAELEEIQEILAVQIEKAKAAEAPEELVLERDEERLAVLLERFQAIVTRAIAHRQRLLALSE